jgi:hypothetical protein
VSTNNNQPLSPAERYPALRAYLAKPEGPLHPAVAEILACRYGGLAAYMLNNGYERATPEQLTRLRNMGFGDCSRLTRREARDLIRRRQEENRQLPATESQRAELQRRGLWREGMKRGEAARLLCRARRGLPLDPQEREAEEQAGAA